MKTEKIILLSKKKRLSKFIANNIGEWILFAVASISALSVLFIFYFIAKDSIPFLQSKYIKEFFTTSEWYPSGTPPKFGAISLFIGSGLVTLGSAIVSVPLGVAAAVCLSDILSFNTRQIIKPIVEILAAIPSVAYGFLALVVLAPLFQNKGGKIIAITWLVITVPLMIIFIIVISDLMTSKITIPRLRTVARTTSMLIWTCLAIFGMVHAGQFLNNLNISTGTNALNVSLILGIMVLPTIVSVSEDSLQAIGTELREGSYALGATRAETIVKTIIPAASSGICAAVLLGIMRALGETMVVWMASGNAAQIPKPFYNFLVPIRTLTATIAADMGEADHVTGSARYHVLFTMGLCLLILSFITNMVAEWIVSRQKRKLMG